VLGTGYGEEGQIGVRMDVDEPWCQGLTSEVDFDGTPFLDPADG